MYRGKYLIIGGTTKAATTSLFNYLSDHPEICASTIKETGYYLDADYPLPLKYQYNVHQRKYTHFFKHCAADKIRLEATPDYLYSTETPHKIHKSLSNVKIIFALREPVSRLISWYRFAVQQGLLPNTVSFDEYVEMQYASKNELTDMQWMRTLEQGRYSKYLKKYLDVFGHENICIVFYEDLARDPQMVMNKICQYAEIEPGYYEHYKFKTYNRTETMRFPWLHGTYIKLLHMVRMRIHSMPTLHTLLKLPKHLIEPFYLMLNRKSVKNIILSAKTANLLKCYYNQEKEQIETIIARPVPWP